MGLGSLALLQQAGLGDGFGDGLFLARRHEMGAGDAVEVTCNGSAGTEV